VKYVPENNTVTGGDAGSGTAGRAHAGVSGNAISAHGRTIFLFSIVIPYVRCGLYACRLHHESEYYLMVSDDATAHAKSP